MTAADLDLDALAVVVEGMTPGEYRADLDVFDAAEGIVACIYNGDAPEISMFTQTVEGIGGGWTAAEWTKEASDARWAKASERQELKDAVGFVALANNRDALIAQARDAARLARRAEALEAEVRVICEALERTLPVFGEMTAVQVFVGDGPPLAGDVNEARGIVSRLRALLTPTKEADRAAE
jgi:hypothetical protein